MRQRYRAQMQITKGALWLLFAEGGLSLTYLLLGADSRALMADWLVATSDSVWHQGKIWTLVTSPLLKVDLLSLLFHGLILWLFVPTLERWWGTWRFLKFALWTSLIGTVVGTLAGLALGGPAVIAGLDPFIYATFVAFGMLYADQHVQFFGVLPMTGKQLMIGIIAFVALFVVLGQEWAQGAAFAAAMGLAWILTNGRWTPRLWWLRRKQKRLRRHLKLVRDDEKPPKKWMN